MGNIIMTSWMCPDCGERVDEENETPFGKCGWCGE
jgi:DNA-directed RNA polymerase subunit RPC12/RpoP